MDSIIYKSDIIKEMSEEMGIPEKEIEEIINLNISYIKQSVIEGSPVMINLPNLCKIRLNYRLALSSLFYTRKRGTRKSLVKSASLFRKIEILRQYKTINDKLLNYKKPLFERLWKKINRTQYVSHIYSTMYRVIYKLEQRTNEIIKEIT